MKKHFKLLPLLLMSFCLTFNSCSDDEQVLETNSEEQNFLEKSSSAIETIESIEEDFGIELIVDETIDPENTIHFETEEEMRSFIEEQLNQIQNPSPVQTEGCANGIYTGQAASSGLASLNFDVSVSDGCISGISGYWSGFTFGLGYTQGESNMNCSSATVCGTVDYLLFFQGIGTVWKESVCYSISLNC